MLVIIHHVGVNKGYLEGYRTMEVTWRVKGQQRLPGGLKDSRGHLEGYRTAGSPGGL